MRRIVPVAVALVLGVAWTSLSRGAAHAKEPDSEAPAPVGDGSASAERGYRWLTERAYLPSTIDDKTFDALWEVWPEPLRTEAKAASPEKRRALSFARYGLTPRPNDPRGRPLQYVVDDEGHWSLTCFGCHGGEIMGRVIPGLPNASFALQTLADDNLDLQSKRGTLPAGAAFFSRMVPLGENHGTTNAVMFSVALLTMRDKDLNLLPPTRFPRFVHHDLDAPPWWNVRKRSHLYLDGFAPKGHRSMMQFLLVPQNGPEQLKAWEPDFKDVLAYIESLRPPPSPLLAEPELAARGRAVFEKTCSRCHGTYGPKSTYPEVCVPIDEIGTDRLRFEAVRPEDREAFSHSWLTGYDPKGIVTKPVGYVAPPLDGIWASAPYFHNGSVPTLWHVLHPDARPKAWKKVRGDNAHAYDSVRVGFEIEAKDAPPAGLVDPWERRAWFDTTRRGKSAAGHEFPASLSEDERTAVLEYLKTL